MTDLRDRILAELDGPGSRTKRSLVEHLDADAVEVTRALGKLLVADEIEEHPEIDNAYRLPENE